MTADPGHALEQEVKIVGGSDDPLAVGLESIAVIGDGPDAVLMFRKSGFIVALGNASDAIKSAASVTTDSYNDENFANAIERLILGAGRAPGGGNP